MKAVVVDEWIPWPLDSGKRLRTFHLVTRLARRHDVIFVAFASRPADDEGVSRLRGAGVRVIEVADDRIAKGTLRYKLAIARNLAARLPFSTEYHLRPQLSAAVRDVVERERPDIVHCEWSNLAPVLSEAAGGPARVIAAHNVESQIWERYAATAGGLLERWVAHVHGKRIGRLERKWYPSVEAVIAVSGQDAETIRRYGAHVVVVDNGVDVAYYADVAARRSPGTPPRLAFVASMDTFANQDAAVWFAQEILPLVREVRGDAEFWIVGKNPSAEIRRLPDATAGVRVTGTVADVREYLAAAAVAVVPLRIGGGSRLKILESMAAGLPVVSTGIGAEGLEVRDGADLKVADSPRAFAGAVLEILCRPEVGAALAGSARGVVTARYDWDSLAAKHSDAWEEAAAKVRGSARASAMTGMGAT